MPKYDNPPVVEVVCGVALKQVRFLAPHLGLFWNLLKSDGYDKCEEQPTILAHLEGVRKEHGLQIGVTNIPPLPRTWFIHAQDDRIIQIQRDRFLFNWRRIKESDRYPGYVQIFSEFSDYLGRYRRFVETHDLGILQPLQYEITYIDQILKGEGWQQLDELGHVFQGVFPEPPSLLSEAETIQWHAALLFPSLGGRLRISIQTVTRQTDNREAIQLNFTVQGMPETETEEEMKAWFHHAHDVIEDKFTTIIAENMQTNVWRRHV